MNVRSHFDPILNMKELIFHNSPDLEVLCAWTLGPANLASDLACYLQTSPVMCSRYDQRLEKNIVAATHIDVI